MVATKAIEEGGLRTSCSGLCLLKKSCSFKGERLICEFAHVYIKENERKSVREREIGGG